MEEMYKRKKKINELQYLSDFDVSVMCKIHNLYTMGTKEQYEHMLSTVQTLYKFSNITGEDLYPIAEDILKHSNVNWTIEKMMYLLGRRITRSYRVVVED